MCIDTLAATDTGEARDVATAPACSRTCRGRPPTTACSPARRRATIWIVRASPDSTIVLVWSDVRREMPCRPSDAAALHRHRAHSEGRRLVHPFGNDGRRCDERIVAVALARPGLARRSLSRNAIVTQPLPSAARGYRVPWGCWFPERIQRRQSGVDVDAASPIQERRLRAAFGGGLVAPSLLQLERSALLSD